MAEGWRKKYYDDARRRGANDAAARNYAGTIGFALEYPHAAERQQEWHYRDDRWKLPKGGPGYGGSEEWPFDFKKAMVHTGYRTGIRRAIENRYFSDEWRTAARAALSRLLDQAWRLIIEDKEWVTEHAEELEMDWEEMKRRFQ